MTRDNDFLGGPPPTNTLAIISLICGIISIPAVCCCYGFPFNIIGLITGGIAVSQIHAEPDLHGGMGLAIGGIVASLMSFAILGLVLLFYAGAVGVSLLDSM
jgi:hypothetical protein